MYPRMNPWIASHDYLVKPFGRTLHHCQSCEYAGHPCRLSERWG
jgi:hypothetical protein